VHTNRWPSVGLAAHGSSVAPPSRPAPQPETAATAALATIAPAPAPSPLVDPLVESMSAPSDARLVSNEKPHKKRTGPAKRAAARTGGSRSSPASDAGGTRSGASGAAAGGSATAVEDQAAAELSMSLK